MALHDKSTESRKESFLVHLIRSSIIISSLDRFTAYVYHLIKNGFLGYIFTGYSFNSRSWFGEKLKKSKFSSHASELRFGICRRIESSVLLYYASWIIKYLKGCRLRVYGITCASFGAYTVVVAVIQAILHNNVSLIIDNTNIYTAIILIVSSIPLISSRKNLAGALVSSVAGRFIMKVTGFSENEVMETVGDGGHTNTAFVIGIILGALTYSLSPLMIILAAAAMVWAYLVLLKPEIGVLTLFFAMPILPTMVLAAVVVYTTFSWSVKLLRGKRMIKIEPVDIMALAFIVMIAMGGFISLSGSSLKPALLMACLGFGYILTVELITSREWIVKCATAFVTAATLIAAYGIFLLMIGGGYSSDAWTDSDMFSEWGGRAVSTLENPNMLGEYLILALPIGFSMFIGRGEGLRRISALFSVGIMGVCLILSFSRGAWLGFLIAMVVYAFIWHGRALWGGFAVAAMLPFMRYILPASIFNRLTSIGNMADSSTSYRVYSWRASVEMIGDYLFSGIGIGEGAWQRVYPMYAYQGVEASPHSHNLFLQIWLYLGIFGILVFAVFIFMLFQSGFTMFSELSRCSQLKNTDISESLLEKNSSGNERMNKRNLIRQSKFQLRMSSAGVLCGILAALMQGITDYTWYNYRVYLMFWLACGLAAAYIRNGHSMIGEQAGHTEYDSTSCEIQIPVADCGKENRKNKRKTRQ